MMVMSAVRWPEPSGENVTEIEQAELVGKAPEQVLFNGKSAGLAPPTSTEEMCKVAGPVLVRPMVCAALVLPCVVLGKVSAPGARVTPGSGDAPVPLSGTDCGLPGALSEAAKLAWRVPTPVGENATLMLQVVFGVKTVGSEQLGVAEKSDALAPITLMELMLRD